MHYALWGMGERLFSRLPLRPQMIPEELGDTLEIQLIGRAGERVRLAGVLEVVDLLAGGLEPIQQIARPLARHRFVRRPPVDLDRCGDELQVWKWRKTLV